MFSNPSLRALLSVLLPCMMLSPLSFVVVLFRSGLWFSDCLEWSKLRVRGQADFLCNVNEKAFRVWSLRCTFSLAWTPFFAVQLLVSCPTLAALFGDLREFPVKDRLADSSGSIVIPSPIQLGSDYLPSENECIEHISAQGHSSFAGPASDTLAREGALSHSSSSLLIPTSSYRYMQNHQPQQQQQRATVHDSQ